MLREEKEDFLATSAATAELLHHANEPNVGVYAMLTAPDSDDDT
jgi:hypothetical protein